MQGGNQICGALPQCPGAAQQRLVVGLDCVGNVLHSPGAVWQSSVAFAILAVAVNKRLEPAAQEV